MLVLQPSGHLTVTQRSTGAVRVLATPPSNCTAPFELVVLRSGLVVVRDRRGLVTWSSTSACAGDSSCYSYGLQDSGELVVTDGGGQVAWSSSSSSAGSGSSSEGWLMQLVSGSTRRCLDSGPMFPATQLVSRSRAYQLLVRQAGARLQLLEAGSGALVWTPADAPNGKLPAQLCLQQQGALVLSHDDTVMWSSQPAGQPATAPRALLWPTSPTMAASRCWTAPVASSGCRTRRRSRGGRRPRGRRPNPPSRPPGAARRPKRPMQAHQARRRRLPHHQHVGRRHLPAGPARRRLRRSWWACRRSPGWRPRAARHPSSGPSPAQCRDCRPRAPSHRSRPPCWETRGRPPWWLPPAVRCRRHSVSCRRARPAAA